MSDDIKKNRFFELRFNGNNISAAAGTLDVSYATAKRWNKDLESVVKSENIKKAIESSILSALSRFENYSNLLSAEFAKLQTDAQKHKSVNLYYEDRMNFLLKIIHMDRRLNNSMLNLLKMNKDLAAAPPDVQSSFENLRCSMDDDKLNPEFLLGNDEIKSESPGNEINAESNTNEISEDNADEEYNAETSEEENSEENDEENDDDSSDDDSSDDDSSDDDSTDDDSTDDNSSDDDSSVEDSSDDDSSDDDSSDDDSSDDDTSNDDNNENDDDNSDDDSSDDSSDDDSTDDDSSDDTSDDDSSDDDSTDDESIKEIIKREYSNGISIAEYEELLKRKSPLKEAEQIMKSQQKPVNKYGGSMYRPKPVDT